MITFKLSDGNEVQVNRESIEEKILEGVIARLDEAREKDRGMYTALKSAVGMLLTFAKIDLNPPKGVNALEFLIAHYIELGMSALEKAPLPVEGHILLLNAKEPQEEGAKDETSRN